MIARSLKCALWLGLAVSLVAATASEASAGLVNVALGGTATQSSTFGPYVAANAVDGVLTNFTHTTNSDVNPTWQVDLGADFRLNQITLYNRGGGCCQYRLRDITVELLAGDGATVLYSSPVLNPGNTLGSPSTLTVDLNALTGSFVSAQFVRVGRASTSDYVDSFDNNVLSLGEVRAWTKRAITGGTAPGGFIETGSGSGLLYHLDAAKGVTASGSAVSSWADQGPAGNDFSQGDANRQPTLVAGLGGNALPALRFDGDNSDPDGTGPLPAGAYSDQLVLSSSTSAQTVFIVNSTFLHRGLDGI